MERAAVVFSTRPYAAVFPFQAAGANFMKTELMKVLRERE
jgi:hypothetical protein